MGLRALATSGTCVLRTASVLLGRRPLLSGLRDGRHACAQRDGANGGWPLSPSRVVLRVRAGARQRDWHGSWRIIEKRNRQSNAESRAKRWISSRASEKKPFVRLLLARNWRHSPARRAITDLRQQGHPRVVAGRCHSRRTAPKESLDSFLASGWLASNLAPASLSSSRPSRLGL